MDEVEGEEGVVVLGNEVLFENIGRELLGLLKEEEKTTGVTGTRVTQILSSLLRVGDTKKNEIQALAQLFHDHSLLLNEEPDFDQNITYTLPAFASNPLTSNSFLSLQLDKAPLKRNEEDFNKHCDLLKVRFFLTLFLFFFLFFFCISFFFFFFFLIQFFEKKKVMKNYKNIDGLEL